MKQLHRPDLFGWSELDPTRNLDFHGLAWARPGGTVLVDPMPMTEHDLDHLQTLGRVDLIVVTNSDHVRAAPDLAEKLSAKLVGPAGEIGNFPIACDRWLNDGEQVVEGLQALALVGSKTPGELALLLDGSTLICGDLVRGHVGGRLNILPDSKLHDPAAARDSVARLAELPGIEAVVVGDGWHVFRDGSARLQELVSS